MAADFSQFLRKPAGEAKRPEALAIGDYAGVIKSFEIGDQNKNKTPYVRFHLGYVAPPPGVDLNGVDLSKRQARRDFYLTEDALWRLDELIKSCGVSADGRTYEEILPQLVGAPVVMEVQQYMNEKANPPEIGNQIGRLIGQS